jgi:hypothetical protein
VVSHVAREREVLTQIDQKSQTKVVLVFVLAFIIVCIFDVLVCGLVLELIPVLLFVLML